MIRKTKFKLIWLIPIFGWYCFGEIENWRSKTLHTDHWFIRDIITFVLILYQIISGILILEYFLIP